MADDAKLIDTPAPARPARPRIRRIEAVVNPLAGGVGPRAAEALERLLSDYGYGVRVCEAGPRDLPAAIRTAVDQTPELLVVLAGDGTAALAATMAGADGPLVAPLPGGTMNLLPHALYGLLSWPDALAAALEHGEEFWVSGGEADGHPFYVAAILGAPALWARAREAMRKGRFDLAMARARTAFGRAFTGALSYRLNDGAKGQAEALALVCPLVSRRLTEEAALEAAALNPRNAAEAFRLGLNALISDWRNDPAVAVCPTLEAEVWARGSIPAILDGESRRLPSEVAIRFKPRAFRALVPPRPQSYFVQP